MACHILTLSTTDLIAVKLSDRREDLMGLRPAGCIPPKAAEITREENYIFILKKQVRIQLYNRKGLKQ